MTTAATFTFNNWTISIDFFVTLLQIGHVTNDESFSNVGNGNTEPQRAQKSFDTIEFIILYI
ncbi:hypothetical protein DERF_007942 [Dermatophagoides farinae]|uniref:Uncharacterized protein n=1 Tax=Dermatophagoides farinae TaxID=6954 RepID=A0A922I0I3_DERFA|nr:hypothetical protein DERF_007942 [Dermatophagoides farinae]